MMTMALALPAVSTTLDVSCLSSLNAPAFLYGKVGLVVVARVPK